MADNLKLQKNIMGIPVNDKLGLGVAACDHHIPVWGGGKGDRLIGVTATAKARVFIFIYIIRLFRLSNNPNYSLSYGLLWPFWFIANLAMLSQPDLKRKLLKSICNWMHGWTKVKSTAVLN